MAFWEQFVEEPRKSAEVIQNHASPGNIETEITYEILVAQAKVAEKILRYHDKKLTPNLSEFYIGLPQKPRGKR